MKFRIQRCKDLVLIDKLKHQCFDKDSLHNDLNSTYWWVAWVTDVASQEPRMVPAGFCGVQLWGNGKAYLSLAGVLPEFRKHGLQKRMIKIRTKWCKEMSIKHAYSYVMAWNTPSMRSLLR